MKNSNEKLHILINVTKYLFTGKVWLTVRRFKSLITQQGCFGETVMAQEVTYRTYRMWEEAFSKHTSVQKWEERKRWGMVLLFLWRECPPDVWVISYLIPIPRHKDLWGTTLDPNSGMNESPPTIPTNDLHLIVFDVYVLQNALNLCILA